MDTSVERAFNIIKLTLLIGFILIAVIINNALNKVKSTEVVEPTIETTVYFDSKRQSETEYVERIRKAGVIQFGEGKQELHKNGKQYTLSVNGTSYLAYVDRDNYIKFKQITTEFE